MHERAVFFGKHKELFGIFTDPPEAARDTGPPSGRPAGAPAVLVLNAGVVHRVGPYRWSVKLARRLAEQGFVVGRFDLAGLGDSEPRRDALPFQDAAVSDVKEAMDYLQRTRQIGSFILMGLCSGADTSYQTACRDERVVGAVMIDGYSYRTPEFHVRHFLRRARQLRSPVRAVRRAWTAGLQRLHAYLDAATGAPTSIEEVAAAARALVPEGPIRQYVREFPPKERFVEDTLALAARGVRLHFIYSAGMPEYHNYAGQFADAFRGVDFGEGVTSQRIDGADHTFTELAKQAELISSIASWANRSFPARGPGVGVTEEAPGP